MSRVSDDRGVVLVFTVLVLSALLAVCALVIDVGSWLTKERSLQSAADAATLAGAQDLPDTAAATSTANAYAGSNISGLGSWSPTFPDSSTIDISLSASAPGTFSKLVGISSVTLSAHARAVVGVPGQLKNVAPVAVKSTAACTTTACFGTSKTLNFDESNLSSSKFGLISLSCEGAAPTSCSSSATGASDLENWIRSGYPGTLDIGKWFAGVSGQKIGPVRSALEDMGTQGTTLLFPVFDTADTAAQAFHVVGWSAFVIDPGGVVSWKNDGPSCRPNCKVLSGRFTKFVAEGIPGIPGGTNYGVRTIELTQ